MIAFPSLEKKKTIKVTSILGPQKQNFGKILFQVRIGITPFRKITV